MTRGEVVWVLWTTSVVSADRGVEIGGCEERWVTEHPPRHIVGELFYLAANIPEECVGRPPPDHHDGEGWHTV